jgi:uncharacterized protein YigA (DUF484 family)
LAHNTIEVLSDQAVVDYLTEHPDFFTQHSYLLDKLDLSQRHQGTVSLVHLQLSRQRQRIDELEEEISALMSLAKSNDRTFHAFMSLQEKILQCDNLSSVIRSIEEMASSLELYVYVRLVNSEQKPNLLNENYQRFAIRHLNGKGTYLGRLRKVDRELLLSESDVYPELGSYAVIPLHRTRLQGVLIFSSQDGGHFEPSMDTLFLRHLALTLSNLIDTLPWQSDNHDRIISPSS